jgi:hypothetical protein
VSISRSLLGRLPALAAGAGALVVFAAPASAAPSMCTEHGADPKGVVATHLYAKLNGSWVEPQNVCVGVRIEEKLGVNARYVRGMYLGIWNTVDGGFPETYLPPGTLLSLGLRLPPGMIMHDTFAGWRNGVVVSEGADTVIQGMTVPWEYHPEAFFGGPGLDCSIPPSTTWQSTFTGYSALNFLNPDRTPNFDAAEFAGGFYESNTVGVSFPRITTDSRGNPTGLEISVQGCGDGDPATHEGYFDGFTPISLFHGFGISDELLEDAALLQGLVELHDRTTGTPISATFTVLRPGDVALEQIPGIAMPAAPAGSAIVGVRTVSTFSYSQHDLVQRGEPTAMRKLRRCRALGGTPTAANGRLVCVPDTTRPHVKLIMRRSLARGRAIVVSCNEPCLAKATIAAAGVTLARGSGKTPAAGRVKVRMKLTAQGRRALAARRSRRGTLKLVVTDRAGNATRLRRGIRLTR